MRTLPFLEPVFRVLPALLFLPFPCLGQAPAADPPAAKPAIFCEAPAYAFGKVVRGRKVGHAFVLENRGEADLRILAVVPGCECTAAPISKQVIEPGGSAVVSVVFDSTEFEGPVNKLINVRSDDPGRPEYMLELHGTVLPPYACQPKEFDFRRVSRFAHPVLTVSVRSNAGPLPKATAVGVEGTSFVGVTRLPDTAPDTLSLELRLLAGAPAGGLRGAVRIAFESPEFPALTIPVKGQLLEDVTVYPQSLSFGALAPGQAFPRSVYVLVSNPVVSVLSAKATVPWLPVSVSKRGRPEDAGPAGGSPEAVGLEVVLRIGEDAPPGAWSGELVIATSSPRQPEVRIPLTGSIQPR